VCLGAFITLLALSQIVVPMLFRIVSLLLSLLLLAGAQPSCVPASTVLRQVPMCAVYVPSPDFLVYANLPVNGTVFYAAYEAMRTIGHVNFSHMGATQRCINMAIRQLCSELLAPCVVLNTSIGQISAFRNPCLQTCTDFWAEPGNPTWDPNRNCTAYAISGPRGIPGFPRNLTYAPTNTYEYKAGNFTAAKDIQALLMPPCSASYSLSTPYIGGASRFGDLVWQISASEAYTVTCSSQGLVYQNDTTFPCYYEAFQKQPIVDSVDGGYCEAPCPRNFYYHMAQMQYTSQVLGWFTFVVCGCTVLLRFSVEKFSRYPANLIQLMLLGPVFFGFIQGLSIAVGGTKYVDCAPSGANGADHSGWSNGNPWNGMCAISAIAFWWCWLVYPFGWCAISLHAAIVVLLKRSPFNRITMYATYFGVLIVPMVFTAILSHRGFESGYSEPYCSFPSAYTSPSGAPVDGLLPSLRFIFFYVPILLTSTIAVACMIVVLVSMSLVTDTLSSWHVKNNIRLLIFLILSLVTVIVVITYKLYYGTGTGTIDQATVDENRKYIYCEVVYDSSICKRQNFNAAHNWAFAGFYLVILELGPVLVALIMLTQPDLWSNWSTRTPWACFQWCLVADPQSTDTGTTNTTAGSSSSSGSSSDGGSTFMSDLQ